MTKIKATLAILAALLTVACNHQASAPGSISPTNTAQSTPATHFSLELLGKRPTDPRTTLALRKALENGFDPDTTNADGIRAIHYAARGGRTDWINLLARHGADLNAPVDDPDNQSQPHHYACRNLDENTLLSLIRNGADCSRPNARTHRGCFQIAVANNTPQIIDFLVQHQCGNIDASTPTTSSPLRSAITKQLYAFADALLDAGADPVSLNDWGKPPTNHGTRAI